MRLRPVVKLIDADALATRYSWKSTSTARPSKSADSFRSDSVWLQVATLLKLISISNKASKLSNAKPSQLLSQLLNFAPTKSKAEGRDDASKSSM